MPNWLNWFWAEIWAPTVYWVGKHVFGIAYEFSNQITGSGDRTFDYVLMACFLAAAIFGGLVWGCFDRERKRDGIILDLLRVGVRYVFAVTMLIYGCNKIFHLQMPSPTYSVQMETYGESSPMRLMWTFMGNSAAYSFFAGTLEAVGGVLMLFRRTTTLGALVIAAVMLNVVVMDFAFDVAAKLYSAHLLLMAIILVWPDWQRLMNLFLFNRPVLSGNLGDMVESVLNLGKSLPFIGTRLRAGFRPAIAQWIPHLCLILKVCIIGRILLLSVLPALNQYVATAEKPALALEGIYKVEGFSRNGQPVPLLVTDAALWRLVAVDQFEDAAPTGRAHHG